MDADGLALKLGLLDLRSLVAPIIQMLDRLSDRHPVVLALPHRPMLVCGDADRLQRVVENLVNNAVKYSPAGGSVEVSIGADHAVIVLSDCSGLGLGLSIAAHVVALHGGALAAQPADGGGTVMVVPLPAARTQLRCLRKGVPDQAAAQRSSRKACDSRESRQLSIFPGAVLDVDSIETGVRSAYPLALSR